MLTRMLRKATLIENHPCWHPPTDITTIPSPRFASLSASCWRCPSSAATADVMELLSGAKLEGKVIKIDKAAKEVTFETTLGGRPYARAYPYSRIHAVTLGDKRYVLTEKPDSPPAGASPSSGSSKPAVLTVPTVLRLHRRPLPATAARGPSWRNGSTSRAARRPTGTTPRR